MRGKPGQTRTISVGLLDHGPGTMYYPGFFNARPDVAITLPSGLSVVRADERCRSAADDFPGGPPPSPASADAFDGDFGPPFYSCSVDSIRLRPGQHLIFSFTVRIARNAHDDQGLVDASFDDIDGNARNNSAPVSTTIDGAVLPVTGGVTAVVAAIGTLLTMLGGAAVVTLRRHRRRPA